MREVLPIPVACGLLVASLLSGCTAARPTEVVTPSDTKTPSIYEQAEADARAACTRTAGFRASTARDPQYIPALGRFLREDAVPLFARASDQDPHWRDLWAQASALAANANTWRRSPEDTHYITSQEEELLAMCSVEFRQAP